MRVNKSVPCYLPSTAEMFLADKEAISKISSLGTDKVNTTDNREETQLSRCIPADEDLSGALQVMQRVGKGVAEVIIPAVQVRRCVILCGPGNNGADGVAIATELVKGGIQPSVVLVYRSKVSSIINELLHEHTLSRPSKEAIFRFCSNESVLGSSATETPVFNKTPAFNSIQGTSIDKKELGTLLSHADLVLDCLLGTGQAGAPRGQIKEVVELVAEAVAPEKVVSIDIPTGVNGDTGEVYWPHITPKFTIAIQSVKRGLTQYPAREVVGDLKIVDIGISFNSKPEFSLLNEMCAREWILPRKFNTHKGDLGTVLVVAGSFAMPGAATLVSLGALHSGSGLVIKAELKMERFQSNPPEIVIRPLSCKDEFDERAVEEILEILPRVSSVIVGPGIGVTNNTEKFVLELTRELKRWGIPLVIDADALNILAKDPIGAPLSDAILTPHPKEASRLLGAEVEEIERDRFRAVKRLQDKYGGTILLKGASTVIWDGKEGIVNTTGSPALATAGSGDVLAGAIASLLAQGYPPLKAAALGAHYHGKAGIQLSNKTGGAITASALAPELASLVKFPSSYGWLAI